MTDPEVMKGEDNVSAPSSFIANAHNQLCAFYTGKGGLLTTKFWTNRRRPPPPSVRPLSIRHWPRLYWQGENDNEK